MLKNNRPGIDRAIEPLNGVTRDGQPLSYNRAPAPDLAPWIARLYATVVIAPPDHRLDCGLFSDTSVLRFQLKGKWQAHTADGVLENDQPAALYFGPQTRIMPVSVTGSFVSLGIALRPGTGHAWMGVNGADYLDRVIPCEEMGLPGKEALSALDLGGSPESWIRMLEDMIRLEAQRTGYAKPDPITARFETLAFTDPNAGISEFARECGVDQRKLERIVHRDFGMAPKQVLRRARALDMASHLRGVADEREGAELALRYYDQSHLIREFAELFGMSPSQFVTKSLPLLTLGLESRQARRLEAIERLKPGEIRPWQTGAD
jgi:AraC-like DNA-binding protein